MGATIFTHFDSTTNKDLLKTGSLRQIFDTTVREAHTWSKKLYNVLTTKDEYERDLRMAGLQNTSEIAEGQQIPIQAPVLGLTKTYTQKSWAGGFRMTFKMDYFNKYGLFKRWAADLARRQIEAKDIELAVPFAGPTGATRTGFDNQILGYATHTGLNPDISTDNYSNILSQALSQSALESARYYFATMVDDMGNLMGVTPGGVLYYDPTLWPTVNEIFASDLRAQELSNTKNIVPKMGFEPYEYPLLGSVTAWGIANVSHPKYDMNLFTSMEPKMFIRDAYDQTLDKVALSYQMFAYGWGDPRMIYIGNT